MANSTLLTWGVPVEASGRGWGGEIQGNPVSGGWDIGWEAHPVGCEVRRGRGQGGARNHRPPHTKGSEGMNSAWSGEEGHVPEVLAPLWRNEDGGGLPHGFNQGWI